MKLVRFAQENGAEGRGVIRDRTLYDLSHRYESMPELIEGAHSDRERVASALEPDDRREREDVKLLAPVEQESSIFCVAANYAAHASEAGLDAPDEPVVFNKLPNSVVGPEDPIRIRPVSEQMDYEAELAVVIGARGSEVSAEDAMEHVAGYTILNDTTARDLQWTTLGDYEIVDWLSSKCLDNSTPVGPWITTEDEVDDPHSVRIESRVNGELRQDESTSLMIHTIDRLIRYISARCTLRPGDLIATGTPEGVGGFEDKFLEHGDRVSMEIESVGQLENTVQAG